MLIIPNLRNHFTHSNIETNLDTSPKPLFGPNWLTSLTLKDAFCTPDPTVAGLPVPTVPNSMLQSAGPVLDPTSLINPTDPLWSPPVAGTPTYGNAISALTTCCIMPTSEDGCLHLPNASGTYSAFAHTDISAFLVCATTLTNDGSISKPFLFVVGHPTVYPLGQTRATIWKHVSDPWSPAMLPPEDIQGPTLAAHVVMGNISPNLRNPTNLAGN
jgi:hypothetical protein